MGFGKRIRKGDAKWITLFVCVRPRPLHPPPSTIHHPPSTLHLHPPLLHVVLLGETTPPSSNPLPTLVDVFKRGSRVTRVKPIKRFLRSIRLKREGGERTDSCFGTSYSSVVALRLEGNCYEHTRIYTYTHVHKGACAHTYTNGMMINKNVGIKSMNI